MKNKTKKFFKKINKDFKKKKLTSGYFFLFIILLSIFSSSFVFYYIGIDVGYSQKEGEIKAQEKIQQTKDLMNMDLIQVWHIFLKYLLIKSMFWLPAILIVFGIGWILHGFF